jgi:hypothetical protein
VARGLSVRPDVRAHALLALATVLFVAPTLGCGLMLYDVGELFVYADAVRRGLQPGVDYVVNGYGPGRYLLFAGLFALSGPSLAATAAVFLGLRLAITSLLWSVARRCLPPRWAALPVACVLVAPGPLHKGFYLAGTLLVVWGLLRYLEAPSRRRAAVYGLILAAVAAFRLDLGGFGVLALLLVVGGRRERWRDLVVGLAPLGWAVLLAALALGAVGSLGPVLEQIADDVAKNQQIRFPAFPGPLRLLSGDGDAFFLWLPIAVYAALATHFLWAVRREGAVVAPEHRRRLAVLLLFGVLTMNQARMKPEFGHLLQAGPMLWLSCAVLLRGLAGRDRGRAALATGLAAALVGGLVAQAVGPHRGDIYTGSFTIPWERHRLLDTRLGRVRLNEGEYAELAPTLRWLDAQPPGPLWVPTNQPLLLPLSGRDDVTGFVGVVYYADDPADWHRVIERLEAARPALAVFVDDSIEGPERTLAVAAPRVHSYLLTTYADVAEHGRFRLMRRIP